MGITVNNADKTFKDAADEIERDIRKLIVRADQAIVSRTPVDTGRARANWFLDFGGFSAKTTSGVGAPSTTRGATWTITSGNVFIHNSVEYIVYLDEGSSAQAPQGIVDPAFASLGGVI